MNRNARLAGSLALAGILAVLVLSDDAQQRPAAAPSPVVPVTVAPPVIAPPDIGEGAGEPAQIVCRFRCAACDRQPTLSYRAGDELPVRATCKRCGRSMIRADPALTMEERARSTASKGAARGWP